QARGDALRAPSARELLGRGENVMFRSSSRKAVLGALALATAVPALAADVTLLNVSYDPTRELYEAVNKAFAASWQATNKQTVEIQQSHGGSGKQARAVIDGL